MGLADPADKATDAAADGNFGGKTNRRAGYSKTVTLDGVEYTEIEWIKRTAMRDGTLASGEGRKLVEHYEEQLAALAEHRDGWKTQADEYRRIWIIEMLDARRLREELALRKDQLADAVEIVNRHERTLAALREPSEAVVEDAARMLNSMWRATARDGEHYAEFDACKPVGRAVWLSLAEPVIRAAVAAAEKEVHDAAL